LAADLLVGHQGAIVLPRTGEKGEIASGSQSSGVDQVSQVGQASQVVIPNAQASQQ
jgi:hypothetical protein